MKDAVTVLVGAIAAIVSIWKFIAFIQTPFKAGADNGRTTLAIAIVAGVIALISFIKFGAGRVNKEEAIHITQQ